MSGIATTHEKWQIQIQIHLALWWQIWVLWSAGAPLTANMGIWLASCRYRLFLFQAHKQTTNNTSERHQKKNSREKTKHVIHCYSKSNPTQSGYRKWMMETWKESAKLNISKTLANQALQQKTHQCPLSDTRDHS